MAAASLSAAELKSAESKFVEFLESTLRPALASAVAEEKATQDEMTEYLAIQKAIQDEIGKAAAVKDAQLTENLRCKAVVEPDTVFVSVGFGVVVEFRFSEAIAFIEEKLVLLKAELKKKKSKVAEVRAHVEEVIASLTILKNPQDLK